MRDRLAEAVSAFLGRHITVPVVQEFAAALEPALPVDCRMPEAIVKTSAVLLGEIADNVTIVDFCHRVAGNLGRLRMNRPVLKTVSLREPTWLPLQVVDVRPYTVKKGPRAGSCAYVTLKVMAGVLCPTKYRFSWTFGACEMLAERCGYTVLNARRRSPRGWPFADARQLVGCRYASLVEPFMVGDQPRMTHASVVPDMRKHNLRLIAMRLRTTAEYRCPQGRPMSFPCHACPTGYKRCGAATHSDDYVVAVCSKCNKQAFAESATPPVICVNCASASLC